MPRGMKLKSTPADSVKTCSMSWRKKWYSTVTEDLLLKKNLRAEINNLQQRLDKNMALKKESSHERPHPISSVVTFSPQFFSLIFDIEIEVIETIESGLHET